MNGFRNLKTDIVLMTVDITNKEKHTMDQSTFLMKKNSNVYIARKRSSTLGTMLIKFHARPKLMIARFYCAGELKFNVVLCEFTGQMSV